MDFILKSLSNYRGERNGRQLVIQVCRLVNHSATPPRAPRPTDQWENRFSVPLRVLGGLGGGWGQVQLRRTRSIEFSPKVKRSRPLRDTRPTVCLCPLKPTLNHDKLVLWLLTPNSSFNSLLPRIWNQDRLLGRAIRQR